MAQVGRHKVSRCGSQVLRYFVRAPPGQVMALEFYCQAIAKLTMKNTFLVVELHDDMHEDDKIDAPCLRRCQTWEGVLTLNPQKERMRQTASMQQVTRPNKYTRGRYREFVNFVMLPMACPY